MSTEIDTRNPGALAVGGEQAHWTEQQVAVLRSLGVDKEVSPAELDGFLHECQRTKLDPFTRQIYLIGRYDGQAKRKVYRSQTGIDGYRVIANRVIREERAELEYEDPLWCGPDGVWHDVWLSSTPPAAAKVVVLKNGKRFPGVATLAEYAARYPDDNPYPMWKKMPANQLSKCAEALALRRAFPQDLEGIYTAEEMEQADQDDQPVPLGEHPADAALVDAGKRDGFRLQKPLAESEWTAPSAEQPSDGVEDAEIVPEAPPEDMSTREQWIEIGDLFKTELGVTDRAEKVRRIVETLNITRPVASTKQLTYAEAERVLKGMRAYRQRRQEHEQLLADLRSGIEGAGSRAELDSVGLGLTDAFMGQRITADDRTALLEVWTVRSQALLAEAEQVPAEMAGA